MVLLSLYSYYGSSPISFDEHAKHSPTPRPKPTVRVWAGIESISLHSPSRFIIITQAESRRSTHFTVPRRLEGTVDQCNRQTDRKNIPWTRKW